PRYTARYGQKCALCHVNPSGGGLRTPYASQKLVPEEIAWSRATPPALEEIDPMIAKHIMIGTDFREFYIGANLLEARANFFEMQADLYFGFQLDPRVTLYYDRGQSNSYELFGLDYLLPTFYVKAGRFVPSYGWKFDDHTMFVRSELGFMPPGNSDVGLEAGWSKGPLDIQAALVNGNRGSTLDNDLKMAGLLNAIYRRRAGPVGAALGVSGYHHPGALRDYDAGGAYGYLTWRNLTWLGEADLFRDDPASSKAKVGMVASHEVTYLLRQGLELIGTYDFFDPDRDRGAGAKSRLGGGVFVMPRSYMSLEALLRHTDFHNGVDYSGRDFTETLFQLHLLY
ncbi:MAG TPA: hypothetical protein VER38_04055, partial [Candidatus Eisenbacteria bacterium]|nr:hypothetical protein [Candidatus Eisenbacteria bacterium]